VLEEEGCVDLKRFSTIDLYRFSGELCGFCQSGPIKEIEPMLLKDFMYPLFFEMDQFQEEMKAPTKKPGLAKQQRLDVSIPAMKISAECAEKALRELNHEIECRAFEEKKAACVGTGGEVIVFSGEWKGVKVK